MKKVVKKGVFDPRNYKENDPHWAKKRKPEIMGPGKIIYTREYMEDEDPDRFARKDSVAEYRQRLKSHSMSPEPEYHYQPESEEELEPEIATPVPIKIQMQKPDLWPKRVRSDITCLCK